jgi:hypothetical protein
MSPLRSGGCSALVSSLRSERTIAGCEHAATVVSGEHGQQGNRADYRPIRRPRMFPPAARDQVLRTPIRTDGSPRKRDSPSSACRDRVRASTDRGAGSRQSPILRGPGCPASACGSAGCSGSAPGARPPARAPRSSTGRTQELDDAGPASRPAATPQQRAGYSRPGTSAPDPSPLDAKDRKDQGPFDHVL